MIKHLKEPFFSLIQLKLKTVEGRVYKKDYVSIKKNDIITFINDDFGYNRSIRVKIVDTVIYKDLYEYLEKEELCNCLPGVDTIENGVKVYRKFYSDDDVRKYGIIALRLEVLPAVATTCTSAETLD